MRHSFSFPQHIRQAVKRHIERAISSIPPQRFRQEPNYNAALAGSMQGVVYEGNDGFVSIETTAVDDRGRGAAEKWSGADIAIIATVSDENTLIKKAILVQSKIGSIEEMTSTPRKILDGQIEKMKKLTRSPKVMEIIEVDGQRRPRILSGNKILSRSNYSSQDLSDYFVRRILTTLDGDTRSTFVEGVSDSGLTTLRILAKRIAQ